jgi:PhnB protein
MDVETYLQFDGRCEEAIEFYKKALGAKVETLMRFKESPDQSMISPGSAEKIMHSAFRVGDSLIMASDGYCKGSPTFQGFSLTLQPKTRAEAEKLLAALGDGGQVQMPLTETFFSPAFGTVADRFGVHWMVVAQRKDQRSAA